MHVCGNSWVHVCGFWVWLFRVGLPCYSELISESSIHELCGQAVRPRNTTAPSSMFADATARLPLPLPTSIGNSIGNI